MKKTKTKTMEPLLKQLLEVPTHSGHCGLMQEFIRQLYPDAVLDTHGNLYITKGESETYPCIVAHMDTVHRIEEGGILALELNGNIYGMNPRTCAQTGIGGDDKCGIWCALVMLHNLPACKVALFVDEEIGCLGSNSCDLEFFKDCRFILQADRRNDQGDHFVHEINGPIMSPEFKEAVTPFVKRHQMEFVSGMMTDVMALRNRKVGVSCANISAGYYRPHSSSEVINRAKLQKAIDVMYDICCKVKEVFPFTEPEKKWQAYYTSAPSSGPYAHWQGGNGGRQTRGVDRHATAEHRDYFHQWYKKPDSEYAVLPMIKGKAVDTTDAEVVEDGDDDVAAKVVDEYLEQQEKRRQEYLDWWAEANAANQADQDRLEALLDKHELETEQQEIQASLGL